jgi:hypothetical protein
MTEIMHTDGQPAAGPRTDLRLRIGWICHGLRIGSVIWVGWAVARLLVFWSDKAEVLAVLQRSFSVDLAGASDGRYAAAVAVVLIDCAVSVVVVICIWRLVGTYLAGRVFSVDAALWLRRTGIAGIAAVVVDVLARIATISMLAGHLILMPPRGFAFFIVPQDLLHLIFAVFVFALAHIFKAAAEMADDHAQIV